MVYRNWNHHFVCHTQNGPRIIQEILVKHLNCGVLWTKNGFHSCTFDQASDFMSDQKRICEMLIQGFWNVWISIDVYTQCTSGLTICSVHFSIHPQMHLYSMHLLAIVADKCRSTRDKRVRDRLLLNQNHI